jgi:hypothetical protein
MGNGNIDKKSLFSHLSILLGKLGVNQTFSNGQSFVINVFSLYDFSFLNDFSLAIDGAWLSTISTLLPV